MRVPFRMRATGRLIALFLSACGSASAPAQSASLAAGADILATAAPVYSPLAALTGGERFPRGAQLIRIHAGKPAPLLPGFAASADANISFDGERVLFAGKRTAADSWQIWELTLRDGSTRRLIAGEGDAIRPFYLPAGRLVYARRTAQGFHLEAAGKDAPTATAPIDAQAGRTVLPLSFVPGSAIPADVLQDGRILFESMFPLGVGSTPELFLVYSDGSGVESYRCDHGRSRWGGAQLSSGDVVLTHGRSLARFTSPLAREAAILAPDAEYAGAIAETASGAWLVSARPGGAGGGTHRGNGAHYTLMSWAPDAAGRGGALKPVLRLAGADVVEPVLVTPRTRPRRHPSGLHDWNYANMMALDARQSRAGDLKTAPAQVRLEAMDAVGHAVTMGTAPVEADGSFLVKTPADRPIRFALLDAKGAVVRRERGWFWIRRGEQRYCVGCHTGPERSSDNRVPAVLLRTTVPADLTGPRPAAAAKDGAAGGN